MRPAAALAPWERRLHHLANLLVVGTGLALFWMAWLLPPPDGWAVVRHPWQPATQHAHVLAAPLLVFAAGVVLRAHALPKLRLRSRSASGLALTGLLVPLAMSGYALQVATGEAARAAWAWLHVATGLAWTVAAGVHVAARRRAAARAGRARSPTPSASPPPEPTASP